MKKLTKLQREIIEYLATHKLATGATIQRALRPESKDKGNIYTTMKGVIKKGYVQKVGNDYILVNRPRLRVRPAVETKTVDPVFREPKPATTLEKVIRDEISYVEAGIDSLMITKSYLQRRLEQLQKGL